MRTPTPRQLELWRLMLDYQASHYGMPATVRELGRLAGIGSSNATHQHLVALVHLGLAVRYRRRGFVAIQKDTG